MNTDEDKILLDDQRINVTTGDKSQTLDRTTKEGGTEEGSSKKKWIIIGIVVAALLVLGGVIAMAVVLPDGGKSIPFPDSITIEPASTAPINNFAVVGDPVNDQYIAQGTLQQQDLTSDQLMSLAQIHKKLQAAEDQGINPRLIPTGNNNVLIPKVSYTFGLQDYHVAYMVMTDADNSRYSIDPSAVPQPEIGTQYRLEMLGFKLNPSPFSFSFTDVTDEDNVLFSTEGSTFVFMDRFIQLDFQIPSQKVFGLGERIHEFGLGEGAWSMWAKGQDSPYDDGLGGKNGYGVHPFMLAQGKNAGDFFGIFFRNSNAQSPLLTFNEDKTSTLHYITTGGQLEAYFFLHKSAKEIIQLYQNIVGKPNLPPFWALGWQQASWKYTSQELVEDMISAYATNTMPLETVYLDIPYMKDYADFTVDTETFPDLPGLAKSLHDNDQRLVLIIDAAVSADDEENKYYKMAQEAGVLIQSAVNTGQYQGALVSKVWPDHAVFFDWFHEDAYTVWQTGLSDLYDQVAYDGLWIDMNEATTFCDGECPEYSPANGPNGPRRLEEEIGSDHDWYGSYADQDDISTYYLPFISGFDSTGNYDNMALSLNATHPSNGETEYNLHNLYGHLMSKTTNQFMTTDYANSDNRPFILTRSSFSGTGHYASHWLGDNWREWDYMRYSIAGMMNMNMFGIPHVGADVCGFFGDKRDDEMCARWIQLSTFYPLARAHQNLTWKGDPDSESSEPYELQGQYKDMARDALFDRYQYLRHQYTCLFEVSQWGGTCIDPLFFYFPDDENLFADIEESFMVGGAIKVSPVLEALDGGDTFDNYFPEGEWLSLVDMSVVSSPAGGSTVTLTAGNVVQAHLRPGTMIPRQDNTGQDSFTTTAILTKPIDLIFNRDSNGMAKGSLLLDGGISLQEIASHSYEYYTFTLSSKAINFFFADGTHDTQPQNLGKIQIGNAANDLRSTDFACYMDMNFQPVAMTAEVDNGVVTLTPEAAVTFGEIRAVYFGETGADLNLCDLDTFQYVVSGNAPDLSQSTASFTVTSKGAAGILPDLQVDLSMLTRQIINVKASYVRGTVGERTPFTVPTDVIDPQSATPGVLSDFVTLASSDPFLLTINGVDGTQVMDLQGLLLNSWLNVVKYRVYSNPSNFFGVSGLGEKVSKNINYQTGVYSMYNRDATSPFETGKTPGNNVYGTDPFFFFTTGSSLWTGVYSNTLQPQDWYVTNDIDNRITDVTSIAIGGVTDLYVLIATDPRELIADFHNFIVGKPTLPPVYALGWNQCRWGYKDTAALQEVVDSYAANSIPLDVQWSDIDYMQDYRSFTVDQDRFGDLGDFVDTLHGNNMHYVPIIDAGIAYRPWGSYDAFDKGEEAGVFINANTDLQETFIGEVWPNEATYLDWLKPEAGTYWRSQLSIFSQQVDYDGLWLDMNEASNFCTGPCKRAQKSASPAEANLLYVPTARDLDVKSISVDATHANNVLEIDAHNLYGVKEVAATHEYFSDLSRRTFIISRSQTTGMGKYGANWLGDNFSTYDYLAASLPGIMAMNMFGITLTGTDICGFLGDTNPDLCLRWTMIGAFFPFARNHNDYHSVSQEPYAYKGLDYDGTNDYMTMMTAGIVNRYHMIRYFYTQFFLASIQGTGSFFRPLFFDFPDDEATYSDLQYSAMLGSALKLAALTDREGQDSTVFYFPAGSWCDIFRPEVACMNNEEGEYVELSSMPHEVYVHLFEGHIIPMQDAAALGAMTTADLTQHPVDFHILGSPNNAFGLDWYAQGTYINDDGEVFSQLDTYNQYEIAAFEDLEVSNQITLRFSMKATASAATDDTIPDCTDVNMNDILGNLFIYNAEFLAFDDVATYTTTVNYLGDVESETIDDAVYDSETKRVVLTNSQAVQVCLPNVETIVLTPVE